MKKNKEDMTTEERIRLDPNFVVSSKHDNSLKKVLKDFPDGAPENLIAKFLDTTEEEVEEIYQTAINKLKNAMGVKNDDIWNSD